MTIVRTRLIRIGNSQGIQIPQVILKRLNWGDEVELEVQENRLVIRPLIVSRLQWEEQFQAMAAHGDDQIPDEIPTLTTWDEDEWEW